MNVLGEICANHWQIFVFFRWMLKDSFNSQYVTQTKKLWDEIKLKLVWKMLSSENRINQHVSFIYMLLFWVTCKRWHVLLNETASYQWRDLETKIMIEQSSPFVLNTQVSVYHLPLTNNFDDNSSKVTT